MHKFLRPSLVSSVNSNQLMSGPESYELRHQILSESKYISFYKYLFVVRNSFVKLL